MINGDTLDVLLPDKSTVRSRLAGDAPDRGHAFGSNAKRFLSDAVFGKDVEVIVSDTDRYGRSIGDVYVDGRLVNLDLVAAGLA